MKKFQSTRRHNIDAPAYKLAIAGLSITSVGFLLILIDVLAPGVNPDKIYGDTAWVRLWFNALQYFTNQTNILMFVYFILFLSAFKTRIFNSNRLTLYVGVYIGIVFLIFWTMLVPTALITEGTNIDVFFIVTQGWLHLLSPLLYFAFMHFAIKYPNKFIYRQISFGNFIGWGIVYPLIYSLYAVIINFVALPAEVVFSADFLNRALSVDPAFSANHNYISVYGYLTNFNPNCYNIIRTNVDDSSNIPTIKQDYFGNYVKLFLVQLAIISFILVLWFDGLLNNLSNSPSRVSALKKLQNKMKL